jgi:membrane protein
VATIARALAYSLFLAIPATALLVLGVFSLVADPDLIQEIVDRAGRVMPSEATQLLEDSLRRSSESAPSGVVMTVSGFALALWTTTSAATTLMGGLTRAHDREDARGFVRKRLVAFAIVVALVVGAALVVSLLVMGPYLERWIGSALDAERATAWAWWTAQWPILLAGLLFVFAVVLYLGPDVEQRTWKLVTPGAVAAVVLWLVASGGLALYASSFGSYEKSWGTLSAVVVTLLWLWVTSAALLFAAEINAETRRLLDADPDTGSDDAAAPTGGLSSVAEDRVPASGPSRSRG